MTVGEIVRSIVMRLAPPPQPPERPMSTPEDVRWARAEQAALVRRAEMLGVDVSLEQTGR